MSAQIRLWPMTVLFVFTLIASSSHAGQGGHGSISRLRVDLPWPDLTKSPASTGGGENDAAVVVAIEKYEHVPGVPGAKKNADAWYNYFVKTLNIPVGNVKLVPQSHATKEAILSALSYAAGRAKSGGRVWFVFIGHGAPTSGDGLLLGVDVRQTAESLEARGLKRGDAITALNKSQAQPVIILDACFSGRTGGGDAVVEGLMPVRNADMPAPGRAIVVTAAAGDQYAGPLPGAVQPAFSYLILGALRGWGDVNENGEVTTSEAVKYVQDAIGALVNGRDQTPDLSGGEADLPLTRTVEKGPDLSEFTRMLSAGDDLEFNQDGLVLGDLPTLNLPELRRGAVDGEVDLSQLSLEEIKEREATYQALQDAKKKVEAAREAGRNDPTGAEQQKAWCHLAELGDPNPFRAEAEKACAQSTTYVEQRRRLVMAMNRDWEKVSYLMSAESYTNDDKKRVMKSFLSAYGMLEEQEPVKQAASLWEGSFADKPAHQESPKPSVTAPIAGGDMAASGQAPADDGTVGAGQWKRAAGHATLWLGVGSVVLGGVATGLAKSHGDKSWNYETGVKDSDETNKSMTWAGVMYAGFGAGAALIITGAVLLASARRAKERLSSSIALAPTLSEKTGGLMLFGEW